MAAEKAYRDQIGFEYEVDIDKRSQLERAKRKMAHIVGSGGTAFMGEELAAHAATIERLEQEISLDPEEAAGEYVTAHAKYAQLLEKCTKAAAKAKEDALTQHADIQAKIAALEAEQLELRKQSDAQMTADAHLHSLLSAKAEAASSHSFQKVLEASDFTDALDQQLDDLFDATWLAQNGLARVPKEMLQAIVLKTRPLWVKAASEAVQSQLEDTGYEQVFIAANLFADKPAAYKESKACSKKGESAAPGLAATAN